jgi:hypothetical protein
MNHTMHLVLLSCQPHVDSRPLASSPTRPHALATPPLRHPITLVVSLCFCARSHPLHALTCSHPLGHTCSVKATCPRSCTFSCTITKPNTNTTCVMHCPFRQYRHLARVQLPLPLQNNSHVVPLHRLPPVVTEPRALEKDGRTEAKISEA